MSGPADVLVYQIGSIGDTIVSIPALRAVRAHFGPDTRIVLLHETRPGITAGPPDVLEGAPEVDEFLGYLPIRTPGVRALQDVLSLALRLRRRRFGAVVYLAPSIRKRAQVDRDRKFFRLLGIPRRYGFITFSLEEIEPVEPDSHPARTPHEAWFKIERLRRTGLPVGDQSLASDRPLVQVPQSWQERADAWLRAHRKTEARPLVALCPGSKQPANLWPLDRFEALGGRITKELGAEVLLVGGQAERSAASRLLRVWGGGLDATGEFPVLGTAGLLNRCALFIGLDTGPTHLAAALGVVCVAIYGERESPGRWEPLGPGHTVLRARVPCAGCRLTELPCDVHGHPCMTGIAVDDVWSAVNAAWTRADVAQAHGRQ